MDVEAEMKRCANCRQDIPALNFLIHEIHCQRNISLCTQCNEPIVRADMDAHVAEQHSSVACDLCGEDVSSLALQNHKEYECHKRKVMCEYCELEFPLTTLQEHTEYCGSRTNQCQSCKQYIMLKDQDLHDDSLCTYPEPKKHDNVGTDISPLDADYFYGQNLLRGDDFGINQGNLGDDLYMPDRSNQVRDDDVYVPHRVRLDREDDYFVANRSDIDRGDDLYGTNDYSQSEEAMFGDGSVVGGRQSGGIRADESVMRGLYPHMFVKGAGEATVQEDGVPSIPALPDYAHNLLIPEEEYSPNIPRLPQFQEENMIPCEFCGNSYTLESIIQHQAMCESSLTAHDPPTDIGVHQRRYNEDLWRFDPATPPTTKGQGDRSSIGLLEEDLACLNLGDGDDDGPPPLADTSLLPCEFCELLLPSHEITRHQEECETNLFGLDVVGRTSTTTVHSTTNTPTLPVRNPTRYRQTTAEIPDANILRNRVGDKRSVTQNVTRKVPNKPVVTTSNSASSFTFIQSGVDKKNVGGVKTTLQPRNRQASLDQENYAKQSSNRSNLAVSPSLSPRAKQASNLSQKNNNLLSNKIPSKISKTPNSDLLLNGATAANMHERKTENRDPISIASEKFGVASEANSRLLNEDRIRSIVSKKSPTGNRAKNAASSASGADSPLSLRGISPNAGASITRHTGLRSITTPAQRSDLLSSARSNGRSNQITNQIGNTYMTSRSNGPSNQTGNTYTASRSTGQISSHRADILSTSRSNQASRSGGDSPISHSDILSNPRNQIGDYCTTLSGGDGSNVHSNILSNPRNFNSVINPINAPRNNQSPTRNLSSSANHPDGDHLSDPMSNAYTPSQFIGSSTRAQNTVTNSISGMTARRLSERDVTKN